MKTRMMRVAGLGALLTTGAAWGNEGVPDSAGAADAKTVYAPRLAAELVLGAGTPVGSKGLQIAVGVGGRVALYGGLGDGYDDGGLQWAVGSRVYLTDVIYLAGSVHGGEWQNGYDFDPFGSERAPLYDSVWVGGEVGVRLPVDDSFFIGGALGLADQLLTKCLGVEGPNRVETEPCEDIKKRLLPQVGVAVGFNL